MPPLLTLAWHFLRARTCFSRLRGSALKDYQDRHARRVVTFAVRHAPFYRALYAGRDLGDWRTLPIIDKQQMMANFDTFNTRGIRRDEATAVAVRAETS